MKDRIIIPHFDNASPFQNRISCAISADAFQGKRESRLIVDPFHGHAWNFDIKPGDGVYGITEKFPAGPLDDRCDGRFVRVPYRRIPRIRVTSYDELKLVASSVYSKDPKISAMWRGQTQLYTLREKRTETEMMQLYGNANEIEPSLLPSASRGNVNVGKYMAAWFGLLDVYLREVTEHMRKIYREETVNAAVDATDMLRHSYAFRIWAFGVAQHYGLPSTGLDLTPDVDVALFFALNNFAVAANGITTISRVNASATPVILYMGVFDGDLSSDEKLAPAHLATPRASAQKAHFFQTAWGQSPNRAAERIVAVFDLIDHANWKIPQLESTLFPSMSNDRYSRFLASAQDRFPEILSLVPLNKIYFCL